MGKAVNLLKNYPQTKRDTKGRVALKTDEDRRIARKFGKEFFDGDRKYGYGGYHYHPRFWQPVIPDIQRHFNLTAGSRVLDIGCAKGFMLFDMQQLIPGICVSGIDISEYAITNAKSEIKNNVRVGNAMELPFEDNSFDVVISITTIHNLEKLGVAKALQEIERVSCRGSFITVDAYQNDVEKTALEDWVLTAKTVMHVDEWEDFFKKVGYTGDYYWFVP